MMVEDFVVVVFRNSPYEKRIHKMFRKFRKRLKRGEPCAAD